MTPVRTAAVRARIVRVGNSRGLRIPKPLLDAAQLAEHVTLRAERGRIVVEAAMHPRAGWAKAALRMRAHGEDGLLDTPTATEFDNHDWEWE